MNASEKQDTNSSVENITPKVRASPAPASKPRAKAVGRTAKPRRSRKAAAPARRATKTAKILALLRRPSGASLQELRKATGWEPHSVRGFLSGTVKKKMGLHIDSVQRDNDERAYHLASK